MAWTIAYKAFNRQRGDTGWFQAVRRSKDPIVFTVLFEDTAAMLGLILALIGVACSQYFENVVFDALASISIGIVLAITAAVLAFESKSLLIGEAAGDSVRSKVREIIERNPDIRNINALLTMHLGPQDILLNLSLDFADGISSSKVESSISGLEKAIKSEFPEITRVFIEAQSLEGHDTARGHPPDPQPS